MKRGLALVVSVAALALFWAPSAQAFECGTLLDDFNRGNSTNLGPNWNEVVPNPAISAGSFTDPAAEYGLATFNGVTSNEACVDVFPSLTGVSYAAIVLKYADAPTNNVFVKIQDGPGPYTGFDQIWWYKGNNATTFSSSQALDIVVTSARFHVKVEGSTVTAEIDTNFDNQPEKVYVVTTLPTAGLGTGIGLGAFGGARLDNFSIPKSEAPTTGKLACGGAAATKIGTDSGDVINGTAGPDVIVALGGPDVVRGRGGRDVICGGNGPDDLFGGPAKDRLFGQRGKDDLVGGPRNDVCAGGAGTDTSTNC